MAANAPTLVREPARDRGRRPGRPLQPAVQPQDDAPPVDRAGRLAPDGRASSGRCATSTFTLIQGESLGVIGPNGAGKSTLLQVLAGIITPSEGAVDVRGHVSGLLTLGAGFDQELTGIENILLARRVPRPRRQAGPGAAPRHRRLRRPRSVHRRADQDLLVGHARPARLRDRDLGRPGHPAARRGARHRRRRLPGEVEAARDRAREGRQGDRARDPRHELGDGVLQPGAAAREGQHHRRGRARRRSSASTRRIRRGARPRSRRSLDPWRPRRARSRARFGRVARRSPRSAPPRAPRPHRGRRAASARRPPRGGRIVREGDDRRGHPLGSPES